MHACVEIVMESMALSRNPDVRRAAQEKRRRHVVVTGQMRYTRSRNQVLFYNIPFIIKLSIHNFLYSPWLTSYSVELIPWMWSSSSSFVFLIGFEHKVRLSEFQIY